MIIRALDADGDWTFGKGKNDYVSLNDAVGQNIQTRLSSFLGDCFFSSDSGIDWFNLLGSKNQIALNLAVSAVILNTDNVLGLIELSIELDETRRLTIQYSVQTSFGTVTDTIQNETLNDILTTEDGDPLTTEDGDVIVLE